MHTVKKIYAKCNDPSLIFSAVTGVNCTGEVVFYWYWFLLFVIVLTYQVFSHTWESRDLSYNKVANGSGEASPTSFLISLHCPKHLIYKQPRV